MAITQNTFTGNGSNLGPFSFTFKWLESTDIKVTVGGVLKTAGTHYNLQALNYTTKDGGQVLFTAGNAPANNAAIRIYRDTDDSALSATFFSGSAIRAQDLNDDFTQTLYSTQEVKARYLDRQSGEMESTYVPNTSTSVVTKGYMETNYGIIDEVGFTRWRQTASAAQTTFTGAGSYGGVLSYVPTKEQVYLNGALQQRDADYAASNGSSIVFNVALTAGDVVDVVCVNNLTASTVSNAANISYGGQFTGQSTRTVAAKLGDVVSVKDFGAVGDGITDDTAAIQAALNYVNSVGGGVVFLPPGRYRKGDAAGTTLIMYSNTTIKGAGDSSVIFFDDKDSVLRSSNDFLLASNTTNIEFKDFKVEGTVLTYLNDTNRKQLFTGTNIDGLRFVNVTIEKVRYMATAFDSVRNGYFSGNRLDYVLADGLRCTQSSNIVITGNTLRRVADDCIAVHSQDSAATPNSGVVISNNVIEACQGIKVMGIKNINITGNVIRRSLRNPIDVSLPAVGSEGNSPIISVNVSNNIISDAAGDRGVNSLITVRQELARSNGGLTSFPGINSIPYPYNYNNNLDSGTPVIIAANGIRICDNTIYRTLPDNVNYSAWGYGQMFDRTTPGLLSDPLISSTYFNWHGVLIVGPASNLVIHNNNISGGNPGFTAILMPVVTSTNIQDFATVSIQGNTIFDFPGVGISCTLLGSGVGAKQIVIQNNTFDLDPYLRHPDHNANNTWAAVATTAIQTGSQTTGWLIGGNVFKNVATTGINQGRADEFMRNIIYSDFVGPGDNVGNKGVRVLPVAAVNTIVPINGDPTSATFGHILNTPLLRSAGMPSSGRYLAGHLVVSDAPPVQGSPGSQYTINGWRRLTTGTGHVANTDWVELRTLTGT